MKRKLVLLSLILGVLIATQAMPAANAWYKRAYFVSDGDDDGIIETGENVVWVIEIYVYNDVGSMMTDIVVTDNLAAELEIDSLDQVTQGTVSWYTTGKSEKVHLTWDVGTLTPETAAYILFKVSTDLNPSGKQEYTSPGEYELNSGPTVKYRVNGVQYSFEIPPIMITVLPPD